MSAKTQEWLRQLREQAGMPRRGQTEESTRIEERARAAFSRIFKCQPDDVEVRRTGAIMNKVECEFWYEDADRALYFQPLDEDGNPHGERTKLTTVEQAVEVIESHLRFDISA